MKREDFIDALKEQYAEEIYEAYLECEYPGHVDFEKLNSNLGKLYKCARAEGLENDVFFEICKAELPADAYAKLSFHAGSQKKAA